MAPSTPSTPHGRQGSEPGSPAPTAAPGGSYSLQDVVPGVKIFVLKGSDLNALEERKAEVLLIRPKPPISAFAPPPGPDAPPPDPRDDTEYYVHYVEFNKRLDEWVGGSKLVIEKEMEWPKAKDEDKDKDKRKKTSTPAAGGASVGGTPLGRKGTPTPGNLLRKATSKAAAAAAEGRGQKKPLGKDTPTKKPSRAGTGKDAQKGTGVKMEQVSDEDDTDGEGEDDSGGASPSGDGDISMASIQTSSPDAEGEIDLSAPSNPKAAPRVFSKKQEIEKLRTSGSMTQSHSEVSRVKNLNKLQIGKHEVESWYFSPYPQEYAHLPILYLCEFCLLYWPSATQLRRHRTKCTLLHPPGNEIYRSGEVSFYEIDGRRQRTWCRNLCLLSKCFLDHKTLYYDVDPFMYYCMTVKDEYGCHLIGYFSKEKESAEGYNVACILTLPQHQRKGYGRLLIEFSYELSKRENKLGSPEKPLSDLGLLSYKAYWQEKIVALLMDSEDELSIDDIAHRLAFTHGDVMLALQGLHMVKFYKGGHVLHLTDPIIERHERLKQKSQRSIDSDAVIWKPPVFSRAQLAFGF